MFEISRSGIILAEVISAYSQCPRKAFLLHCSQERGTPHDYQAVLDEQSKFHGKRYLDLLRQAHRSKRSIRSYNDGGLSSGADIITEGHLQAIGVEAYCDVLTRVGPRQENPGLYEPTLVVGTYGVEKEQIFDLSIAGYVLGQLQQRPPATGHLVTGDGECRQANLQPQYKTVSSTVERIRAWSSDPSAQPPPVILNKHCPYCPFQKACTEQAEAADDLSLLDRMTPKAMRRYHSKGIFTVNQLSFLFKPRRRRRRQPRQVHFNLEIQALALRTGKTYIQSLPEIQRNDVELFLDIEGVPDQQFCYLIGLLVHDHESVIHHAFWADSTEAEESIWRMFVHKAREYPDAPIYHYGSYEARAITSLAKKFGPKHESESIGKRLVNLSSHVYGKVYFPVRSNSLKVLGKFLGASWAEPGASGLQSLVWRYRWELTYAESYKQKLISYNAEDCQALHILTEGLVKLRTDADSQPDVDYVDQPKQNATSLGSRLHAALDHVLLHASFDYAKKRITFRPETDTKKKKGPGAKGPSGLPEDSSDGSPHGDPCCFKEKLPRTQGAAS